MEVFRHGLYRVRDIHTHVNHLTLFGANDAQLRQLVEGVM